MEPKTTNRKICVLIVDDDANNLQVLGNILKELHYHVEFALDGIEALNWLQQKEFDLVLLDIAMPRMDGFEVCTSIKKNEDLKHIPVIFITARVEIENAVKGFKLGAVDYITKPFNKTELQSRISTHIDLKRSHDELKYYTNELKYKNKLIIDSIIYAERIQQSILPKISNIKKVLPDSFVLFRPKDIISGDFYWFKEINNDFMIAVVDCTGHGVPGAIMSIIGYTGINQAVNEYNLTDPVEILRHLNKFVIDSLHITDQISSVRDGMDIGFCYCDRTKNQLIFASALLKVVVVRNNEIMIFSGARKSIGEVLFPEEHFTNQHIDLMDGDMIYLFTDGFTDQFGGQTDKKYLRNHFFELLKQIAQHPMEIQKHELEKNLLNWMGNANQTDDITVIGFKYNTIKNE